MILLCCVSGCVSVTPASNEATCDGTSQARADHAAALADDASDAAVVTWQALIAKLDAACRGNNGVGK